MGQSESVNATRWLKKGAWREGCLNCALEGEHRLTTPRRRDFILGSWEACKGGQKRDCPQKGRRDSFSAALRKKLRPLNITRKALRSRLCPPSGTVSPHTFLVHCSPADPGIYLQSLERASSSPSSRPVNIPIPLAEGGCQRASSSQGPPSCSWRAVGGLPSQCGHTVRASPMLTLITLTDEDFSRVGSSVRGGQHPRVKTEAVWSQTPLTSALTDLAF